ncbi:unnamed protein product [Rhizophagus irregularis]|nr:unnamed protein product [Rhizophagus irregularis]
MIQIIQNLPLSEVVIFYFLCCSISRERGLCLRPSEPLLSIDVHSIRRLLGIFRNGSYDKIVGESAASKKIDHMSEFLWSKN